MGITKKTLQNRISLGKPVPPYIAIPNSRRRWLKKDVGQWLLGLEDRRELRRHK
jgi:hypothetical protein